MTWSRCLHICVDAVRGAEDDGLVEGHGENDGLDEDDVRPFEGVRELDEERPIVFAVEVVARLCSVGTWVVAVFGQQPQFAFVQEDRGVRLAEEEVADGRVEEADDGQDPVDPAPAQAADDEAAE